MRTRTLAGWLAMAVLAGCDPMVDDEGNLLDEDETIAATSSGLTTNDYMDETFNGSGRQYAPTKAMWLSSVAAAGSEKVAYASGYYNAAESRYEGVVGRLAKGDADPTWNPAKPGKDVVLNDAMLASNVYPTSMIYVAGSLFVAGSAETAAGNRGFIAKLDGKGNLVDAFDGDGVVKPQPKNWTQYSIKQILVDDAGRLVTIGGGTDPAGKKKTAIARYNATTGAQELTYGTYDEDASTGNDAYKGWAFFDGQPSRGAIGQGRNELVFAADDVIMRLTSAGKLDAGFDKYPLVDTLDIAVASDKRVYALTHTKIAGIKSNGDKDTDFGLYGYAWLMSDEDAFPDEPHDSLPQFWGNRIEFDERVRRIYVAGTHRDSETDKAYFGTYGFLPNGDFDFTWGGGRVYTDFKNVQAEVAYDMALQGEKIILAGQGDPDSHGPITRLVIPTGSTLQPCVWNEDGQASCDDNHKCKSTSEPLPTSRCFFNFAGPL